MIYGELGITLLCLSIQSRILNFWARIINGKPDKLSVIFYNFFFELHKRDTCQSSGITYVQSSLDKLGLSDVWRSQTVNKLLALKNRMKSFINDIVHNSGKVRFSNPLSVLTTEFIKIL